MAQQFTWDYFFVSVLPILLLLILVIVSLGVGLRYSERSVRELSQNLRGTAQDELERLGIQIIRTKARDVARQVEIYLRTHLIGSRRQLLEDEDFWDVALQPVGETGYTVVYEAETGIIYVHPDRDLVGQDLMDYAEEHPDFASLYYTGGSEERAGYYEWVEDGEVVDKYMVVTPVGTPFGAKTLMVAATTTIEEFLAPVEEMGAQTGRALDRYQQRATRFGLTIGVLALLVFGGAFVMVSVVRRRTTQRYTRPLEALVEMATGFGEGALTSFDLAALLRRQDEIGVLAQALTRASDRVDELLSSLRERTADLEHQSFALQTAADVGRVAISILETQPLIEQVTALIRERFEFYYVGLFMIDESGQWVEYRAGSGPTGTLSLEPGDRLEVGGASLVGWCAERAELRVVEDTGLGEAEDASRRHLLAATRSEVVLPLLARGRVIGVLNVQSDRPGAFDRDTVVVLQTVAGQVSVALENARLFTSSQEALAAQRRAYGEMEREVWLRLLRSRPDMGYRRDVTGAVHSVAGSWESMMQAARREGRIVQGEDATLAVPIKGGGDQVLGVLRLRRPEGTWSQDDLALVETLTERLSQALESARLYHETQRRAAREQAAREITSEIRRPIELEAILRAAVASLGEHLGVPRAYVRLTLDSESPVNGTDRYGEE
jgi:GAF domain-containing protein